MLSEILLVVVSFFDYGTLVVLRLTNRQLLRFADRYSGQLAFRRTFDVYCLRRQVQARLCDLWVTGARADNSHTPVYTTELDSTDNERLIGALSELHSFIGPHAVCEVFLDKIAFPIKMLVDLVPALRHASDICLKYAAGSSPSSQEYIEIVSFFERPTTVEFWEIPTKTLVAFLENFGASQLKNWAALAPGLRTGQEKIKLDVSLENIIS